MNDSNEESLKTTPGFLTIFLPALQSAQAQDMYFRFDPCFDSQFGGFKKNIHFEEQKIHGN